MPDLRIKPHDYIQQAISLIERSNSKKDLTKAIRILEFFTHAWKGRKEVHYHLGLAYHEKDWKKALYHYKASGAYVKIYELLKNYSFSAKDDIRTFVDDEILTTIKKINEIKHTYLELVQKGDPGRLSVRAHKLLEKHANSFFDLEAALILRDFHSASLEALHWNRWVMKYATGKCHEEFKQKLQERKSQPIEIILK